MGEKSFKRNSPTDWDSVLQSAKRGALHEIPSDVQIRCYNQLRRIGADNAIPMAMERTCSVFYGPTATGKSRRAWFEGSLQAYCKDPNTKWWDGYRSHDNVIIDEFRGAISISHILRWIDRYPVLVEPKGTYVPLCAKKFWITSNLHPRLWYPDLDQATVNALLRRLNIVEFHEGHVWQPPIVEE